MFLISKLVQPLLFPPGCFLIGLWFVILFVALGKRKLAIVLSACMAALLYAVSVQPVAEFFIRPLESAFPALELDAIPAADCMVVLGGGAIQGSPEEPGKGASLGPESLKRLVHAYRIHLRSGLPILVSGGSVFRADAEPESIAAKRLLQEMGVPPEKILTDSASRNTWENAVYSRAILGDRKNIILVSSAYHMKRGVACFEANGFACVPAPADYKSENAPFVWAELLPDSASLRVTAAALREYWGLAYYRLSYLRTVQ